MPVHWSPWKVHPLLLLTVAPSDSSSSSGTHPSVMSLRVLILDWPGLSWVSVSGWIRYTSDENFNLFYPLPDQWRGQQHICFSKRPHLFVAANRGLSVPFSFTCPGEWHSRCTRNIDCSTWTFTANVSKPCLSKKFQNSRPVSARTILPCLWTGTLALFHFSLRLQTRKKYS